MKRSTADLLFFICASDVWFALFQTVTASGNALNFNNFYQKVSSEHIEQTKLEWESITETFQY